MTGTISKFMFSVVVGEFAKMFCSMHALLCKNILISFFTSSYGRRVVIQVSEDSNIMVI